MLRRMIKKLNNFKFTALLVLIISGVAALYALGCLFMYHFAGPIDLDTQVRRVGFADLVAKGVVNGVKKDIHVGSYLGMVLYFAAILTFFVSVYVAYSMVPFVQNKEKTSPRKGLLLAGFVSSVFEFVLIIFMILLMAIGHPQTLVAIIVTLPFGLASMIGSCLYIIPWLKCDFYMPAIEQK